MLLASIFSLIVFWLAHVYAGTITGHGKEVKTVILGVLGFLSFAERGYRIPIRIVGALTTAFFGVLIIAFDAAVH
ncbi:hypothetical protein BH09ACT3_BH09ACT3_05890 [soil metagenome]